MRRIDKLTGRTAAPPAERYSVDDWMLDAALSGLSRPLTTWGDNHTEPIGTSFEGYVQSAYRANGVIFAVILARTLLFTEARFQFQQMSGGRPGALFGNPSLSLLERPWPNATTSTLLGHMEQDVSLAGNAFIARRDRPDGAVLRRLRPDWVDIVVGSPNGDPDDIDAAVIGYLYWSKGYRTGKSVSLLVEDVAHFAPVPDPTGRFRGMSWLTPVIEEIRADNSATVHKGKFFDNAATPNLAVTMPLTDRTKFLETVKTMDENHKGASNAYKTLWLMGGADAKVVGNSLKDIDYKAVQGAGETRIAAAGGVPPIIVGLSEGLEASTYSNYGQARRKMGDHWARPQWRDVAGCLESILPAPAGSRLWYDDRHIAFLREDMKDEAEILGRNAQTIRTLVDAGYDPSSVVAAVEAGDFSLLSHSGLYSVQLQEPGATATPVPAP